MFNFMRQLQIKEKIILLVFIVSALSTTAYTLKSIKDVEMLEKNKIRSTLTAIANGITNIVGDEFHERITDKNSIPAAEHYQNVIKLSNFAKNVKAYYVYTYVEKDGKIYFTSTSATDDQIKKNEYDTFFYEYGDIELDTLKKVIKENKVLYHEYKDGYGNFGSVFIPFKTKNGKIYVAGADFSIDYIDEMVANARNELLLIGLYIFIVSMIVTYLMVGKLLKPLQQLAIYTKELIMKNFSLSPESQERLETFSEKMNDEVGNFSKTFLHMQKSLAQYLKELQETTAAKEKIQSELKIAHNIQMSMVPHDLPETQKRNLFDIKATMVPAKEVGGDLYDYFFIDNDRIGVTIADVSGKGVPAALFMAVTKTLIKSIAANNLTPAEVLANANIELCKDNDTVMFVTLFFGIFNIKTGELCYANAGHNPPVLFKNNGSAEYLKMDKGIALGVYDEAKFVDEKIMINCNDIFFAYTDGVTEAINKSLELFGEKRLLEKITEVSHKNIPDLVNKILKDISAFADGAEQADDITILTLKKLS